MSDKNILSSKKIYLLIGFIIFILILTAYSNSLYAPFTLDDNHSFVKETKILNFTFTSKGVLDLTRTKFGIFRFLPLLTFALDLQWGKGSILAFHITNIIIHLLAAAALFMMLQNLFQLLSACNISWPIRHTTNSQKLISIFTVGIWALTPVQTSTITYLVQRMASMAALFCFLSLGLYFRGRALQLRNASLNLGKIILCYGISLLMFICGFLCKEITAILPGLVLLEEFFLVNRGDCTRFIKRNKYLLILSMLAFAALLVIEMPCIIEGYKYRHFTLSERLLTEARVVTSYIFLLLLPWPGFLNLEYDPIVSKTLLQPPTTLFSILFLATIILIAWKTRKQCPLCSFCIGYFFVTLLIESTFIPLELRFDHRLYLPSAGFYLLVVITIFKLLDLLPDLGGKENEKKLLLSVLLLLLSCLSLLTYKRNMVWQDSVTLHRDCVRKSPLKARAHGNLARALGEQGKYDEAIKESEKAISLGKKGYEVYWTAAANLLVSLTRAKSTQTAIERGELLLKKAPEGAKLNAYPTFLHNLGGVYLKASQYQKAFNIFMKGFIFAIQNKNKEYWQQFVNKFANDIIFTLAKSDKEKRALDLGIKSLPDIDLQKLSPYEKMAAISLSCGEVELASNLYRKYIESHKEAEKKELWLKITKIKHLNQIQKQKGTLKTKYFLHPFASKFNFYMATAYFLAKKKIPCDFLIGYLLNLAEIQQPNNVDVALMRSWQLYQNSKIEDAIHEIDKAIKIDNQYAQLWVNRGLYCLDAGRYGEALAAFSKVTELYPGYPKKQKLKFMINIAEIKSHAKGEHNDSVN